MSAERPTDADLKDVALDPTSAFGFFSPHRSEPIIMMP